MSRPRRIRGRFYSWLQYPEAGSAWHALGDHTDGDVAADAALAPTDAQPPGTVTRVESDGRTQWLGVMGIDGAVRVVPEPDDGGGDWFARWEGPRAEGPWMLAQCGRVPRTTVVLAAVDCARWASGAIFEEEPRPLRALDAAERWARGEAMPEEVAAAATVTGYAANGGGVAARMRAQNTPLPDSFRFACWAAQSAARVVSSAEAAPQAADAAELAAVAVTGFRADAPTTLIARRRLAKVVRARIALGIVLRDLYS